MREILFRGKRKDNGEWVEGYYYHEKIMVDDTKNHDYIIGRTDGVYFKYWCITETISEYTGLTDKNGKRIFEGDVFAWNDNEIDEVTGKPYPDEISVVCFDDKKATFVSKTLNGACESLYETISCENSRYIGNIHDNPELLKGGG